MKLKKLIAASALATTFAAAPALAAFTTGDETNQDPMTYADMVQKESTMLNEMIGDAAPDFDFPAQNVQIFTIPDGNDGRVRVISYINEEGDRVVIDRIRFPN